MSMRRLLSLCLLLFLNLLVGFIYLHSWRVVAFIGGTNDSMAWNTTGVVSSQVVLQATMSIVPGNNVPLSRRNSDIVFPHPYEYLISPNDLCTKGKTGRAKFVLLVLVCSAVSNFEQRKAIRETWGSTAATSNNTASVRLGFLLGWSSNSTLQQKVAKEAADHSDIIQENFVDSYQNLTLKSVMLLKWVTDFCSNVHFVLKTDDDMYINIANLVAVLTKLPLRANVMYGVLFRKAKPNRNSSAKWFVPKTQFEGDVFPDYLSGTGYVMSRDIVPKLLQASFRLPFLVMEDVFITGLCAGEAKVKRFNVKGFAHWRRQPSGCAFRDAISGHHVTVYEMRKIWGELKKGRLLLCKPTKKGS